MKKEVLFEILGELDDTIVLEAAAPAKKKTVWKIWGTAAAMAAVLTLALGFGLGGWLRKAPPNHHGSQAGGGGHDGGSQFMSYAGPIFPMTSLEDCDSVYVRRALTYDFSSWRPGSTDLPVTDAYTLTNSTGEAQTLTLLYPFAGNLWELQDNMPVLTLEGETLQTVLYAGGYPGGFPAADSGSAEDGGSEADGGSETTGSAAAEPPDLTWLDSWEQYRALLADGRYQSRALDAFPDLSATPVTVYRFTEARGPAPDADAGIPNPSIQAAFTLDYDKTTVLAYGFNGTSYDREAGTMIQEFSIPPSDTPRYNRPCYLFVIGADIRDLTVGGYVTGGADPDTRPLPDCSVKVERYETDLESALRDAAEYMYEAAEPIYDTTEHIYDTGYDDGRSGHRGDFALYFGLLKEYLLSCGPLSENGSERFGIGWLEELNFVHANRVFYLKATVTVPAGSSITVTARMTKKASFDFYCGQTENRGVYGYDLATRLGSRMCFTEQTARVTHTENVEFVRQNYGFDLPGGITCVTLDPATERYYLEVRKKPSE